MATTSTDQFGKLQLDRFCLANGSVATHDPYTVAVVDGARGVIVGHVPHSISAVCYLFLVRNGTINCDVTATRQYSLDLPPGGLEIHW